MSVLSNTGIRMGASAAGGGSVPAQYVEEAFSTFLYEGNGGTQSINNGIDLEGEGGLIWIKNRSSSSYDHQLADSARGNQYYLRSDSILPQNSGNAAITSFNDNGFSLGNTGNFNHNGSNHVSWTFRKAPGFFDVVKWSGDGANPRNIAHDLGSVPGCIIIKRFDDAGDWKVYHRSSGTDGSGSHYWLKLNENSAAIGDSGHFPSSPTDAQFTVSTDFNASGADYVAYIFAHDDQRFGDDEDESIIKCGTYTGNGSTTGPEINLGWEPQWVMLKRVTGGSGLWMIADSMRGAYTGSAYDPYISAESSNAEYPSYSWIDFDATGFNLTENGSSLNGNSIPYVYIAIRRGPMKTPEAGTEVFHVDAGTNNSENGVITTGFPVDLALKANRTLGGVYGVTPRITGFATTSTQTSNAPLPGLYTSSTGVEGTGSYPEYHSPDNTTIKRGGNGHQASGVSGFFFKRAPGFFDVVCWTGDGAGTQSVYHSLGVTPELLLTKSRDAAQNWLVGTSISGMGGSLYLNSSDEVQGYWRVYPLSSTTIWAYSLSNHGVPTANASGTHYISFLFATLPGISKVGSYDGTGNDINVNCGFTAGARLVIVKRTDADGDWYTWDTARGIVAGNDPYLFLNADSAEVTNTDYIDPLSTGFTITSGAPAALNASGGKYLFLAIA